MEYVKGKLELDDSEKEDVCTVEGGESEEWEK